MNFLLVTLLGASFAQEILYEWLFVDFAWPSPEMRQTYLETGQYIPKNNALTGVKYYNGVIYVAVPRWLPGVPSTLNYVDPSTGLFVPYPSWEMNSLDPASTTDLTITYVQSMEIDSRGWMWILDTGRL